MDVVSIFLLLAGIIIIGYLGELTSKRFNISSALFLLVLGFILQTFEIVDAPLLASFQTLFGTLALIVLLFDGGLSLKLEALVLKSGSVFLMGLLTTLFGIAGSILVLHGIFGFDIIVAAILGAIAGGIGSSTTISIVGSLSVPHKVKDFLTLESSITDVFSIVLTIVLTQALLSGALDFQKIGQDVFSTFSVGAVVGFICALIYIGFMHRVHTGYNYMVTFAVLLCVYAITELLNGSGAIAALILGIALGNQNDISRAFRLSQSSPIIPLRDFQNEISFFVRTFFFVYLGIIVSVGNLYNLAISVLFMFALILVRFVALYIVNRKTDLEPYHILLTAVNPRGLATAVLATFPLTFILESGKTVPASILNQLGSFPEIAFDTILLSIILTTVLVPFAIKSIQAPADEIPHDERPRTKHLKSSKKEEEPETAPGEKEEPKTEESKEEHKEEKPEDSKPTDEEAA